MIVIKIVIFLLLKLTLLRKSYVKRLEKTLNSGKGFVGIELIGLFDLLRYKIIKNYTSLWDMFYGSS